MPGVGVWYIQLQYQLYNCEKQTIAAFYIGLISTCTLYYQYQATIRFVRHFKYRMYLLISYI